MRKRAVGAISLWFLLVWTLQGGGADCGELTRIRRYIQEGWTRLERSNTKLLESAADPKVAPAGGVILYVPASESTAGIIRELRRSLKPSGFQRVHVEQLPDSPAADLVPGLLYLPHPYVVPGGRFNEMYGWDSYFILLGLLQSGRLSLAKDMTDNFIYEVEHYGKVLNANRTYYLTRSQPPFLTRMVLEVYARTGDRDWLRSTLNAIRKYYDYWTEPPHLTPESGLSRYYGGLDTPAPEVTAGELDSRGRTHYDRVREYYHTHPVVEYDVARYYDSAADRLTPLFYLADRAMRESGFDPSGRFGPFSAGILDYNPVDLNCLIYRMEMDTASIYTLLDQPREAALWAERAAKRAATINRLMWGEREGLYFDYDFTSRRQSSYRFITTFYPLWAGIATQAQAARVAANLVTFERAGGLQTSAQVTGNQWDAPFGWAPMQILSVEGLRRYGFQAEADRVSVEFLFMVLRDFAAHHSIKEKYDVVTARSDLGAGVRFGYASNEIGFGWTNAAFLVLYDALTPPAKARFLERCRTPAEASSNVTIVKQTMLQQ
jgi:alpha,alpha-trehalase